MNMHRLNIRRIACWGLPVILALSACSSGSSSSSVATTLVVDHTYSWVMSTDVDPSNDGQAFDTGPFFRAIYESLLTFKGGDTATPSRSLLSRTRPIPTLRFSHSRSERTSNSQMALRSPLTTSSSRLTASSICRRFLRFSPMELHPRRQLTITPSS